MSAHSMLQVLSRVFKKSTRVKTCMCVICEYTRLYAYILVSTIRNSTHPLIILACDCTLCIEYCVLLHNGHATFVMVV